jgi:hypothetical protein
MSVNGAAESLAAGRSRPLIGWMIDRSGSYEPVFLLVSSLHIFSALAITLLIPRVEPVGDKRGVLA